MTCSVNTGGVAIAFENWESLCHGIEEGSVCKVGVSKQLTSCSDRVGRDLRACTARSGIGEVVLGLQ